MRLAIPMLPKGKARPRQVAGGPAYMSRDYVAWIGEFRTQALAQARGRRIDGPFLIAIRFETPSGRSRSDVDNAAGSVLDALQDRQQRLGAARIVDPGCYPNDGLCRGLSAVLLARPKQEPRITVSLHDAGDVSGWLAAQRELCGWNWRT